MKKVKWMRLMLARKLLRAFLAGKHTHTGAHRVQDVEVREGGAPGRRVFRWGRRPWRRPLSQRDARGRRNTNSCIQIVALGLCPREYGENDHTSLYCRRRENGCGKRQRHENVWFSTNFKLTGGEIESGNKSGILNNCEFAFEVEQNQPKRNAKKTHDTHNQPVNKKKSEYQILIRK